MGGRRLLSTIFSDEMGRMRGGCARFYLQPGVRVRARVETMGRGVGGGREGGLVLVYFDRRMGTRGIVLFRFRFRFFS